MKAEEIKSLFESFESITIDYDGVKCWSARELYPVLGYAKWDRFKDVMLTRYACYLVAQNGDQALFGLNTAMMKRRVGASEKRPLADFLSTLAIKTKDFAAEITSVNVQQKDLHGQVGIEREHIDNNTAVRSMLC